MKVSMQTQGEIGVVRLQGRIDAGATGELYDLLVAAVRSGRRKILVEFAEGSEISRPAVRGLVVAASVARAARSRFRICAGRDLAEYLRRVSFHHLLAIDPDRASAIAHLSGPADADDRPSRHLEDLTTFPPISLARHMTAGR